MAGNEWIGGYLDAILDSGSGRDETKLAAAKIGAGRDAVTAAKYFVNEVTGHDDAALYRTWIKASATKYPQERGSRMEYLCWRIWHIARRKKQMEWDDAQRLARRHLERQRGAKEAADEMSCEDLSEGEKEKPDVASELPPIVEGNEIRLGKTSNETDPADQKKEKRLYIVLISMHGLVRGDNMELGRDSDTGGQVKYVVELARALALMPEVYRVDLLTRQICDPAVDYEYGDPTEMLTVRSYDDEVTESGESCGAYIVRIPCGPKEKYIRKELLWPYIQEFVDGALSHILNMARVLGDQINNGEAHVWPHVIHGHYADAGDSASLLSGALNVPMVLTGHSLGRNKLEQLLTQGRETQGNINATYKIMRRIEAEELSLDTAELVITSTRQEIEEQWGLYDGFNVKTERALRIRARRNISCHGRYMPRMVVIPPGMDFSNVVVQDAGDVVDDVDSLAFSNSDGSVTTPVSPRSDPPIWSEIMRFFTNPHKPMILVLARPDPKKNITSLLEAFGETRPLRDLANLVLIMGNRDDIDNMSGGNADVLVQVLKLIDKYDLYGQVAYPKHHRQSDVPEIYRLAAKTKGVFINPALVEPFGLTLIEAAAHGLPMVATKNGGPVDIQKTLSNGLLVDPHNQKEIADALFKLVSDRNLWIDCRRNGLKNIHLYSWPEHCRTYLSKIAQCRMRHPQWQNDNTVDENNDVESQGDSLRDVRDISLRLSLDGDKLNSGGSKSPADFLKALERYGVRDSNGDQVRPLRSMKSGSRLESMPESIKRSISGTSDKNSSHLSSSKVSLLRRRKKLIVIAVDSYNNAGQPNEMLLKTIKAVIKAQQSDSSQKQTGLVLSTALTSSEVQNLLNSAEIPMHEFDALIVSSGSELYYPSGGDDAGADLHADPDYDSHIDYRWGGDGLRKTLASIFTPEQNGEKKVERALAEDEERFNSHCLAYKVLKPQLAPSVDQIRLRLRQRGLRCHVMYCQNEAKMRVIPLLAARSQALRYLFVRWGLDVANMLVIVGETGDTDHEELLSGTHKTVIVKGAVTSGCDRLLRVASNYARGDVAPADGPYISTAETVDDVGAAVMKFTKSRM
ncbi:sucrose-phosphate synthase [Marchantia polymorpha subsp. ruderalis]|uniref:Sucrose-phosphate synthase n=2 Tax=Marchantia polymorpha TaxID=3197 RepID=A0A176W6G9_MARPO|nr:hypothetical protein AXG93_1335s1210 [Marchantia polymorpha subsp. ruderalis]PTQ47890.1 hypothetical protein MARPO_0007s0253 [Marchantia polymorpha]BBN04205.1 hypothetical protein Mp_3g02650 [Marchantia polymorpha subsp. ruderalis]|eukprot:PTQ47890.1 hypothetical protein MARPO_0007s0253 [Marchantia polymorpha]